MSSTDVIPQGPGERDDRDEEKKAIVGEEERVLARVQKNVATRQMRVQSDGIDYDAELLSLRDQIQEARLEDVPPLIEEMERLTEVAARRAKVTEGAVDPDSPYFGRLVLEENEKKREVLIGRSTYLDPRTGVRIVDWRDAPVSRIYYRYEEGDLYEENFGGRDVHGEVLTRRSLAIGGGQLRRIGCPQGVFVRAVDGTWRRAGDSASRLHGGQGAAMRPEGHHAPGAALADSPARGKLGTGIEGREDRFLPEITALIDPRQFELITKADAGLVVIQGGAGSGKTTIGLHRLAYLAYQDPKRFRPDRMLVIVYNDALVRYISRVLPSLGAAGTPVTTYERWAARQRIAHLRGLPDTYHDETPGAVTRLKKHPVMLRVIDDVVARAAQKLEGWLAAAVEGIDGADDALAFFRAQDRAPLALRMQRLVQWVAPEAKPDLDADDAEDPVAPRAAPRSVALRHAIERTVQRARRELLDVSVAWAEMLTDRDGLRAAFETHAPGELDEDDLRTALQWCVDKCGTVVSELELRRDEGEREKDGKDGKDGRSGARADGDARPGDDRERRALDEEVPSAKLVARKRGGGDDDADDEDEDDDRSVGIDGAAEVEPAMLDREDDALLLRLVQRLRGPLVKGKERVRYEHVLIDEAQDLSPVELAVVMGCTTKQRSVTMAGDVAQRLHMDNGFTSWQQLLEAIRPRRAAMLSSGAGAPAAEPAPIAVEPLKVQYRSTHEIIELAQQVLGPLADPESGHAIRSGAPVELFRFAHNGEAVAFLGEALRELMQTEPRASVALISRYPEQADVYYRGLLNAEVPHLRRIAEQDFPFKPGIDVTDVRQVKGLEFDYVVLLEVSRASYPVNDESRHLLHIAATRAAHQLWITASGEPSLVLPESLRDRAY